MKFIDIFLSESAKSELLAQKQGPKLLTALKKDRLADQEMSADELTLELESMDPTNGKMLQWLVNQYAAGIFKLEDAPRVSTALTDFNSKKRSLKKKDINQYKHLADLEDALEDTGEVKSKKQQKQSIKTSGAKVVFKSKEYSIIELRTEAAACYYGKGTKWCTAADNNNMFKEYDEDGPLFVIIDHVNNRKYQFHPASNSYMDEQDRRVDYKELASKYPEMTKHPKPDPDKMLAELEDNDYFDDRDESLENLISVEDELYGGNWTELKEVLLDKGDPWFLTFYAINQLRQRWPNAEPAILADNEIAVIYAESAIKGRWPELESKLMKDPANAYYYADQVIEGRWPEAEPIIMKNNWASIDYALGIIKGRWPEAEQYMSKQSTEYQQYEKLYILNDN